MSFKKILMTASALALLGGNAFADGGPVPEPAAPPPEPVSPPPEEPAPPPPPPPAPFAHWYLDAHGGRVWADDFLFERPSPLSAYLTDLDAGWGAGGALGYRWENNWRAELEATYRHNGGIIFDSALPILFDDVDVNSVSVMVNVLYDMDVQSFFMPYIGFGLGGSHVSVDPVNTPIDDSGWGFAYQFLGGISIPMPNTAFEFFADYRYLSTTGLKLDFGGFFDHNDEYHTHNLMGGIRFNF